MGDERAEVEGISGAFEPVPQVYHRLARRREKQKAAIAVAHSVLTIIYHLLRDKRPYADLGADYFDKLDAACIERHHRRLEQLGYTATLTSIQVA